jgi:hypothetical protein
MIQSRRIHFVSENKLIKLQKPSPEGAKTIER